MLKNLPASAEDIGDAGSIPRSGRSSGGGNGSPLQYTCLENPMDRGACSLWGHKEWNMTEHARSSLVELLLTIFTTIIRVNETLDIS